MPDSAARLAGAKLIVICHHGVRSLQAPEWLRWHGVENAQRGIDAWSRLIDASMPRY